MEHIWLSLAFLSLPIHDCSKARRKAPPCQTSRLNTKDHTEQTCHQTVQKDKTVGARSTSQVCRSDQSWGWVDSVRLSHWHGYTTPSQPSVLVAFSNVVDKRLARSYGKGKGCLVLTVHRSRDSMAAGSVCSSVAAAGVWTAGSHLCRLGAETCWFSSGFLCLFSPVQYPTMGGCWLHPPSVNSLWRCPHL